jgi:hypothetical protein
MVTSLHHAVARGDVTEADDEEEDREHDEDEVQHDALPFKTERVISNEPESAAERNVDTQLCGPHVLAAAWLQVLRTHDMTLTDRTVSTPTKSHKEFIKPIGSARIAGLP